MDTIITNGTIVNAAGTCRADVLIKDGCIVALGTGLPAEGARVIDAAGAYVLPGGIDVHTHLDMPFGGTVSCDDFQTGTKAAAVGGTTALVDFAIQSKGDSLAGTLATWKAKAEGKAVIDYGFHVAVTDLNDDVLAEMPVMVEAGVSSFKLFMAYKGALMVDDATLLRTLQKAKECGALISVHAENGDVIDVLVKEYLAAGKNAPKYHAVTRPPQAEGEATGRAIFLAGLAGAPIYIVHLSCKEALDEVRAARDRGAPVFAETCPQYLALSIDKYEEPGFEGAKYVCSPPLRARSNWDELWAGLAAGDLQVVATDHCPFNFKGQKELGLGDFSKIPNGAPGIEHRLLLLHTLGVVGGRISMSRLVDVFSTAPAKLFGMYPQKGTVAPGSDADLVIFDPAAQGTISAAAQTQNVDYTPYEGMAVKGAVRTVLLRGEVIVENGAFVGAEAAGKYLYRKPFTVA
ncbi:MAG: dihydropyrimidinase [Thermoleophilia bacterium]